ncbi:MAG: hypothetical protein WAM60_21980 [Candidatus Promineifilaceae bacterium]
MNISDDSKIGNFTLDIGEERRPPLAFLLVVAGLGFLAFFTGTKLVASVGNNIGPFEVVAMFLFILAFFYFLKNKLKVQFNFTILMLILIVVTAVLSLPNLADRIEWGAIQFLLLVYTTLLVLVMYNVLLQFPGLIKHLLRFLMLGAFVAGVWIILEGILSNATIGTAGPFRNRVHAGIYMLTTFWLLLFYFFWPGVSKVERIADIFVILVVLYSVAVSGRRSVYLSFFIGLAILAMSFLVIQGRGRFKLSISVGFVGAILLILALIGPDYIPQLGFFYDRIGLIDDRLQLAIGNSDDIENSDNFIVLQREGMIQAVSDHPLLGIGWGAFFESKYSPTGHEMHSTPQRYLAELGIIGFTFYLLFNLYLAFGSLRLFLRVRQTKYQLPALIIMVAIWSLAISWAYNRSVTERTYWLLMIVFISFDTLVSRELAKLPKPTKVTKAQRVNRYPRPEHSHAPPVLPYSRK